MYRFIFIFILGLTLVTPSHSDSAPSPLLPNPQVSSSSHHNAYQQLFTLPSNQVSSLFSQSFLAQVPSEALASIQKQYVKLIGKYVRAESDSQDANKLGPDSPLGSYKIIFKRGYAQSKIHLNTAGKIDTLWFGAPVDQKISMEQILTKFAKLPGISSIFVIDDKNKSIINYQADQVLAVGSSFKLYILKALIDQVKAGKMKFEQVINLNTEYSSLPSGITQNWPKGTPVTLSTLAHLMISISDNTATDHLLHTIGRTLVEAISPKKLRPFLSTRELFLLKLHPNINQLRSQYIAGNEKVKRTVLTQLKTFKTDNLNALTTPNHIKEIEWHVSTRELCKVITQIGFHPSLTINSGLITDHSWDAVAYKGGSEPGVLNYTHLVRDKKSKRIYCIAATINNSKKNVESEVFTTLVNQVIVRLQTTSD
jgi:beta-lactamase class A